MDDILKKAAILRLAVFDVDGVLTDGRLILGNNGNEYKSFHVHDGLGLVLLKRAGLLVAVISARKSDIVSERMAALGIEHVYQGEDNKREALLGLMQELKVQRNETAFVGDDLIDLPAMTAAGLSIAVGNAHPLVREHADWVTQGHGGRGAVREVCELLLEARGQLESVYREFLP